MMTRRVARRIEQREKLGYIFKTGLTLDPRGAFKQQKHNKTRKTNQKNEFIFFFFFLRRVYHELARSRGVKT